MQYFDTNEFGEKGPIKDTIKQTYMGGNQYISNVLYHKIS